jgi:hypothetical protein
MSDPDTKSTGKFEPPPWEREAFEALAARRAEEQATANILAAAASAAGKPGDAAIIAAEEPTVREVESGLAERTVAVAVDAGPGSRVSTATVPGAPADDRAVEAMLMQLQAEERSDGSTTKWVGWVASAITFVLGAAMLIFGLLAARDSGGKFANVVGSGVLSVFGLCFMGMALWVWISTNRSRGRS